MSDVDHTPPRLSEDGAQLLAEVLAARQQNDSPPVSPAVEAPPEDAGHPRTSWLLAPAMVVVGGLVVAVLLSFGMGSDPVGSGPVVDVEVAGVVEEAQVDGFGVQVDQMSPGNAGVRLFDLSINVLTSREAASTERFDVSVIDSLGQEARTIAHFVEPDVAGGQSTRAMVRVEGAEDGPIDVIVRFDGDIIATMPLR